MYSIHTPPMDAFRGDRFGQVIDPYGHQWSIATHKIDLSQEQIKRQLSSSLTSDKASAHSQKILGENFRIISSG